MNEIAHEAGVSVSSVSRVLSKSQPVSEDLYTKVMDAAARLGYEPKQSSLSGNPGTIGLFQSTVRNHIGDEISEGIRGHAAKFGWDVVLIEMSPNQILMGNAVEVLSKVNLDGLILLDTSQTEEHIQKLSKQRKIPVTVVNRAFNIPGVRSVHVDYKTSAYTAVKYLMSLNHKKIAYLSAPPSFATVEDREAGMKRALNEKGLELKDEFISVGQASPEGGYIAMNHILEKTHPDYPTGIIAHNDLMAMGALHSLKNWGLKVPEDVSIIAFYDSEFAMHTEPPLTVIAPPLRKLGAMAATMLIEMITQGDNRLLPVKTSIESTLLLRESTGILNPNEKK
ncbi:MAG: LacI family DNA-binding transcriptional regulator [Spirochaetales bacterium]|nr:LacI family DNA-binding transcriptional regulator [Spirochaetales bacterium]